MMFYIYFQEAYDGVPAVSKLPYLVTALKNRNLSVEVRYLGYSDECTYTGAGF